MEKKIGKFFLEIYIWPTDKYPRPRRQFHMTVIILVLILIGLQVLILVLEDDKPVLAPSLVRLWDIQAAAGCDISMLVSLQLI